MSAGDPPTLAGGEAADDAAAAEALEKEVEPGSGADTSAAGALGAGQAHDRDVPGSPRDDLCEERCGEAALAAERAPVDAEGVPALEELLAELDGEERSPTPAREGASASAGAAPTPFVPSSAMRDAGAAAASGPQDGGPQGETQAEAAAAAAAEAAEAAASEVARSRAAAGERPQVGRRRLEEEKVPLRLQDEYHRIERMGLRQLKDWYEQAGFPIEPDMERQEFTDLLKQVTRWEMISADELLEEYLSAKREFEPSDGDPDVTAPPSREEMVFQLMTLARMQVWESKGYHAKQIGNFSDVMQVVVQCTQLDTMDWQDLLEWYKSAGLPVEKCLTKTEIGRLLKAVTVWHALPLRKLLEECRREDCADEDPAWENDEERRNHLVDRLLVKDRLREWDARGYKATRLGGVNSAISVVEQFEGFLRLDNNDLRNTCTKAGLPETLVGPDGQGREDALKALKTALVWELMPTEELRKDCEARGMPTKFESASDEALHSELLQRLRVDLIVGLSSAQYAERGIPVEHLSSWEIASVAAQLDQIEEMTLPDLLDWYKGTGLPQEKGLQRQELVDCLKKVTVWLALPMPGLLHQCARYGVLSEKEAKAGGREAEYDRLVNQLLVRERLPCWESRGFPASRIGNPDTVVQAVAQYVHFQGMNTKDLRKTCKEAGLTKLARFGMDRQALLAALKTMLVWELLPFPELRIECASKGLLCLEGRQNEREESLRWLVAATFCNSWVDRGIPGERLGSLEAVESVVEQVDRLTGTVLYSDMIGRTAVALQSEYKKVGLPFDPKLDTDTHVERLKQVMVWRVLPMAELLKECQARDVSTVADPAKMIAFMTETTKRGELIKRLIVSEWSESWTSRGIPAERFASLEALEGVLSSVDRIARMGDTSLRAEYRKMGLQEGAKWETAELVRRLTAAIVWEHLPMEELRRECLKSRVTVDDIWSDYKQALGPVRPGAGGIAAGPAGKAPSPKAWRPGAAETWRPGDVAFPKRGAPPGPGAFGNPCIGFGPPRGPGPAAASKAINGLSIRPLAKAPFGGSGLWKARTPEAAAATAKAHTGGLKTGGATARGPEDARRMLMNRLFEQDRLQEWEAQGVPASKLGDSKKAIQLLETIEQMSLRELSDWYQRAGFPEEKDLLRSDMARLAKMVTIWEALPLGVLDRECTEQLLPGLAKCNGTDDARRGQLVEQLLVAEQMRRWDAAGFQATRIADVGRAMHAVQQYGEFQRRSDADLRKMLADAGMQETEGLSREAALQALKTVLIWELMPITELERECSERKIDMTLEGSHTDGERTMELAHRLRMDMFVSMCRAWYELKGIPVSRIGTLMASHVAEQIKHIEGCSPGDLEKWYSDAGLPKERDVGPKEIAELWKRVTVWSCLPPPQLRSECELYGVSLASVIRAGDVEEQREELVYQLLLAQRYAAWERAGLQARRLGRDAAVQAVAQMEQFKTMREDELRVVYREVGLPHWDIAPVSDVMAALTTVLSWELMPLAELEKDCRARGIPTTCNNEATTEGKHSALLSKLQVDLRVSLSKGEYDKRGIPIEKLGSWRAAGVAAKLDELDAMSTDELKAQYLDAGLPRQVSLERAYMLRALLTVLIWDSLSLEALQRECMEKKLPTHVKGGGDNGARDVEGELVRRLIVDFCVEAQRTIMEKQGIPVTRLGSLAAADVADKFDAFERMTFQRLLDTCQDQGLPPEPQASRAELVSRLREIAVLDALPLAELRAECRQRNVPTGSLPLDGGEEQLREQFLDAAKLTIFRKAFEAAALPMHQIRSFKAAVRVAREWSIIDKLLDAEAIRRYGELSLSAQYLKPWELRQRLKRVAVWVELPFKDLQHECVVFHVNSVGHEADRRSMIRRLANQLWPPRANPAPPQPPPRPPPQPPPRPPPLYVPQSKVAPYFRALELPPTAKFDDVKKAYRRLALKYHPDKNHDTSPEHAARAFRTVAEAYEKLSDHFKDRLR